MKKLLALLLCLALCLSCAGFSCAEDLEDLLLQEPDTVYTVSGQKTVNMYVTAPEYAFPVELTFLNNVDDLPYLSMQSLVDMLNKLAEILEDPGYKVTAGKTGDGADYLERENSELMLLYPDTIFFSNYDSFVRITERVNPLDPSITGVHVANPEGLNKEAIDLVSKTTLIYRSSGNTVIDLSKYYLSLPIAEEEMYIPFQTVNDLLICPLGVTGVYNGEHIIVGNGIYSRTSEDGTANPLNELFFSVPAAPLSEELAVFSGRELCLALDLHYGLKEDHGIDNFLDLFVDTELWYSLTSTDPNKQDHALAELLYNIFLDGHSGFLSPSPRSDADVNPMTGMEYLVYEVLSPLITYKMARMDAMLKNQPSDLAKLLGLDLSEEELAALMSGEAELSEEDLAALMGDMPAGEETAAMPDGSQTNTAGASNDVSLDTFFSAGVPAYEEVGNTAYICFDSFVIDTERDYYAIEELTPNELDTVELIMYANSQIHRENSPIENVVIDLTCNSGGAADAALCVIAWVLGTAPLSVTDINNGDSATTLYCFDANRDHVSDNKDSVTTLNRYCLITPASFSCGNLVPFALHNSGYVTLLGITSGGGACVVQTMSTAAGTTFAASGRLQVNTLTNGSYYHVDRGVEPDYHFSRITNLFDRQFVTDFINSIP